MTADDRAAAVAEALERVRAYLNALDGFYGDDWQDDMIDSAAGDGAAGLYLSDLRALALDAQPGDTGQAGGLTEDVRRLADKWDQLADGNESARGRNTKVAAYYRKHAAELRTVLAAHTAAAPGADTVQALDEYEVCTVCAPHPSHGRLSCRRNGDLCGCPGEVRAATGPTTAPNPSHNQTCPGPHDHMARCWNAGAAARAES